jgi:hypothetical protein
MGDVCGRYAIRVMTIAAATWTPIVAPITCDYFAIRNASAGSVSIRSDEADADTEKPLPAGASEIVVATPAFEPRLNARFKKGSPVFYMKPADGNDNASIEATFIY